MRSKWTVDGGGHRKVALHWGEARNSKKEKKTKQKNELRKRGGKVPSQEERKVMAK